MKALFICTVGFILQVASASNATELNIAKLGRVVPGKTTQDEVTQLFGRPERTIETKDLRGTTDTGTSWEYLEKEGAALSISFEPVGKLVSGWTWEISHGAKEEDLTKALNHFPEASWNVETVKWVNPHQIPTECYFKDYKHGVLISFNRAQKKVVSISRWNPLRKISSEEYEIPPKYCIGGGCIEAKLSKDVFKESPLCVLPLL